MANHLLKIGHGNGHNEHSLVQMVKKSKCASFGCSEADRLLPELRQLPGSEVIVGGDGRAAGEVPIILKSSHKLLGFSAHKISELLPAYSRTAPERWSTSVRYAHPLARQLGYLGVAHINWHPDAGPKQLHGTDKHAPILREYIKARDAVKQDIRHARAQGYLVVVGGDLQMTEHATEPWAPKKTYASLGLNYITNDLDWMAFDPAIKIKHVITPALYDHNAIIATFEAA